MQHLRSSSTQLHAAANQQAFLVTNEAELAGVPDDVRSSMQANVAKALAGLKPGGKENDKEYVAELPPAVVARAEAQVAGTIQHVRGGTRPGAFGLRFEQT